jgi:hypothetical protein
MMPRLKAEEQLAQVDATALAMGHYDKGDTRRKLRALREAATGDAREARVKASPAQLGAIGIGVRMLPAPEKKPLSDV